MVRFHPGSPKNMAEKFPSLPKIDRPLALEQLHFNITAASEKSRRHQINQDNLFRFSVAAGEIFVVSDGMGSRPQAERASNFLCDGLARRLQNKKIPGNRGLREELFLHSAPVRPADSPFILDRQFLFFTKIIAELNDELVKNSRAEKITDDDLPAATLLVAYVERRSPPLLNRLSVFWAGDSRTYLRRHGQTRCLTVDDNCLTLFSYFSGPTAARAAALQAALSYTSDPKKFLAERQQDIKRELTYMNDAETIAWWKSVNNLSAITNFFGIENAVPQLNVARVNLLPDDVIYLMTDGVSGPLTPDEIGAHENAPDLVAAVDEPRHPARFVDDDTSAFVIQCQKPTT